MDKFEFFAPKQTALVIVDMQNDFCHENGAHAQAGLEYYPPIPKVSENVKRLVAAAHQTGALPVYVRTTHDETTDSSSWLHRKDAVGGPSSYTCATGSWGAEFYELKPEPGDILVLKHRHSAFIGTNLDLILRSHHISSVAVTGVATNVCVDCTLRDGLQFDYHVALISDASSATSKKEWEDTLDSVIHNYGPVCKTEELISRWRPSL
jgi:ureidoacrylate peracid hydrolase